MWQPPWRMRQPLASAGRDAGMRSGPGQPFHSMVPSVTHCHALSAPHGPLSLSWPYNPEARTLAPCPPRVGGGAQPHPGTAPHLLCSHHGKCTSAARGPPSCSWRGGSTPHGCSHRGPPLGGRGSQRVVRSRHKDSVGTGEEGRGERKRSEGRVRPKMGPGWKLAPQGLERALQGKRQGEITWKISGCTPRTFHGTQPEQ